MQIRGSGPCLILLLILSGIEIVGVVFVAHVRKGTAPDKEQERTEQRSENRYEENPIKVLLLRSS